MVSVGNAMVVSAVIGSSFGSVTYLVKNLVENKIAAGYLRASDEVSIGDKIEIDGEKGKVVDFSDRNIHVLVEPSGKDPYIYEEEVFKVLKNPVKNYTLIKDYE